VDIVSTISTSIELAKRLREISKNIENAEFKSLLADLYGELADLKLAGADLKERHALQANKLFKSRRAMTRFRRTPSKNYIIYIMRTVI
jgi:hypothetical protein